MTKYLLMLAGSVCIRVVPYMRRSQTKSKKPACSAVVTLSATTISNKFIWNVVWNGKTGRCGYGVCCLLGLARAIYNVIPYAAYSVQSVRLYIYAYTVLHHVVHHVGFLVMAPRKLAGETPLSSRTRSRLMVRKLCARTVLKCLWRPRTRGKDSSRLVCRRQSTVATTTNYVTNPPAWPRRGRGARRDGVPFLRNDVSGHCGLLTGSIQYSTCVSL